MRHTIQIRPSNHHIGPGPLSGKPAQTIQGYELEFFRAGEFVERRAYSFSLQDQTTMMLRINNWVEGGKL